MGMEQRKHPRFKARDGAFAAVFASPEKELVLGLGHIVDMSEDGIAFRYMPLDSPLVAESVADGTLEMFWDDGQSLYSVPTLACKVVYDKKEEPSFGYRFCEIRRCGLQFLNIEERHLPEMENFIGKFGIGAPNIA